MESIATKIRRDIRNFGIARAAYKVFMKAINLCFYVAVNRVAKLEVVNPDFLESDEPLQWRFLNESQMFELARNPDTGLTESFVQTVLEKDDECYAAFDGEGLAGCGWYSNKPTDDDGLTVHFGPDYIYQYAGFTHPKYRGRRLHAIGMNRALREYHDRGFKGFIAMVDSHNFSSQRSADRLGWQYFGYVVVFRIRSHVWILATRGCRKHDFFLAKSPAAVEPVPTA